MTGIITGAKGVLSPEGGDSSQYDNDWFGDLPGQSLDLYYHTSDEEKRQMLPVGPDHTRARISVTHTSLRAPDFRRNVSERDRGCCVLTGQRCECEAAHVVLLSKGNEVCRFHYPIYRVP